MNFSKIIIILLIAFSSATVSYGYEKANITYEQKVNIWNYYSQNEDIYGVDKAYAMTIKKFKVTEDIVKKVKVEALMENWLDYVQLNKSSFLERLTCYEIGFKYGKCASLSIRGKVCDQSDDISVPVRCRNKNETQKGIEAATQRYY